MRTRTGREECVLLPRDRRGTPWESTCECRGGCVAAIITNPFPLAYRAAGVPRPGSFSTVIRRRLSSCYGGCCKVIGGLAGRASPLGLRRRRRRSSSGDLARYRRGRLLLSSRAVRNGDCPGTRPRARGLVPRRGRTNGAYRTVFYLARVDRFRDAATVNHTLDYVGSMAGMLISASPLSPFINNAETSSSGSRCIDYPPLIDFAIDTSVLPPIVLSRSLTSDPCFRYIERYAALIAHYRSRSL